MTSQQRDLAEARVAKMLGLAGYALNWTFEDESRRRGLKPRRFPRPAPKLQCWPRMNRLGSLDQVVIIPAA